MRPHSALRWACPQRVVRRGQAASGQGSSWMAPGNFASTPRRKARPGSGTSPPPCIPTRSRSPATGRRKVSGRRAAWLRHDYQGKAWYRRTVRLPADWAGQAGLASPRRDEQHGRGLRQRRQGGIGRRFHHPLRVRRDRTRPAGRGRTPSPAASTAPGRRRWGCSISWDVGEGSTAASIWRPGPIRRSTTSSSSRT